MYGIESMYSTVSVGSLSPFFLFPCTVAKKMEGWFTGIESRKPGKPSVVFSSSMTYPNPFQSTWNHEAPCSFWIWQQPGDNMSHTIDTTPTCFPYTFRGCVSPYTYISTLSSFLERWSVPSRSWPRCPPPSRPPTGRGWRPWAWGRVMSGWSPSPRKVAPCLPCC